MKTVRTVSSVGKRATSPVDAEYRGGCRETGQDYRGGTTSSPGKSVPGPAETCQLNIAGDQARRHNSSSEHRPVLAHQAPLTAGRTGGKEMYCQLFHGQLSSKSIVRHRCSVLHHQRTLAPTTLASHGCKAHCRTVRR